MENVRSVSSLPFLRSPSQEFLTEHFRWRAVEQAHRLLEIIDKRWPAEKVGEPRS